MTNQERINDLKNSINYWNEKLAVTVNNVDRGDLSERIRLARKEIEELSKNPPEINSVSHSDATPIADRIEKGIDTKHGGRGYVVGSTNVFRVNI